jgi:hypothetical protein
VAGSGSGQGKEFSNIYGKTGDYRPNQDIIIPLVPRRSGAGFRLSLLDRE